MVEVSKGKEKADFLILLTNGGARRLGKKLEGFMALLTNSWSSKRLEMK
jgi:hypothetical protein